MRAVIAEMPKHWLEERERSEIGQRDEMWEGVLHMPPMPNRMHQVFVRDLLIYLQFHWAKPLGAEVHQEVNLTTPEDESRWTKNYRIPDLVLLTPDRFAIDKNEYMVGAPLVVVEVRSPGDDSMEKLPFYAHLGVPEVWIFERDTKELELFAFAAGQYEAILPGADGWYRSAASTVCFRQFQLGQIRVRIGPDDATAENLPTR